MRRSLRRPLAVVSSTLAIALLLTVSAEAQRKKAAPPPAKKKPAATAPAPATAKPKPDTTKPETPAADDTKPAKKAPAAEEETEKPKETEKEPERASDSGGGGGGGTKPIMVDLGVGIRGFQRHLSYKDDADGRLPKYDLNGAPEADLALGVFPIKNSSGSFTAGFVGSFGYAFALGSTYKVPPAGSTASPKLTTKAMQLTAGAKANFIFGTSSLGVAAEFGLQNFAVALPPPTVDNAGVPEVSYKFIKPSLSARIGVMDKLSIVASAGYLLVLSAGPITTPVYFESKRASVGGVDASLGVAYEIAHHIEIRPALDYRHYFYKFNWSPAAEIRQAPYPAGGALDQYLGISAMVAFRF